MLQPSFKDIIQRLENGQLYQFPGGVHPEDKKHLSCKSAVATTPLPGKLIIPVRQHIGIEGSLLVKTGDKVLKGQPLTQSGQPYSVPVHAPTSGEVTRIGEHVTAHPSGLSELCIEITPDGKDTWGALSTIENYHSAMPEQILTHICEAGISGMGGAGFPSHIKASASKPVEFLIINGIECEPYITSDDRLMREYAGQIIEGVDILRHLLNPQCIIVAIEDNKPEALATFRNIAEVRADITLVAVETKYPAGGEKQLIEVLTGREVPGDGLPIDVGVTMFNVGTCYAIADAVIHGKPLLQRIVTVTGEAVEKPGNYWTLLGTPINHLLSHTGYLANKQTSPQVIMGGPMMGFTLNDAAVPVVKTTNCLLVPAAGELTQGDNERACIRCSACADACPVSLLPQQLFWHSKAKEYDKAEDYNLFDCIECGACAYVCPSEIPLVHYYRKAKSDIRLQRDEKNKAEKAKERFEARKARLEREKREREEKHLRAKAAREASAASKETPLKRDTPTSKDKVAAALARAKARKAAQTQNGENETAISDDTTAPKDKKAAVAAAVARAKAKKAQQVSQRTSAEPTENEASNLSEQTEQPLVSADDEKKKRVAAAVARAKAKKAQQASQQASAEPTEDEASNLSEQTEQPPVSADDEKKKRIAAAVAKAKAKKAQQASQQASAEPAEDEASNLSEQTEQPPVSADDEKKKRIAAAVAKAKAKKAQQASQQASAEPTEDEASNLSEQTEQPPVSADDEKKKRIAAAVAKAKAKRAAKQQESD